jgi:hypothetical protein
MRVEDDVMMLMIDAKHRATNQPPSLIKRRGVAAPRVLGRIEMLPVKAAGEGARQEKCLALGMDGMAMCGQPRMR